MDWDATMSVHQREGWVEQIFGQVKDFVASYGDRDATTCTSPCITTLKNSYVRGQIFPYVNIPIRYREKELLGLYEYYGDQLPLSDQYVYCDIVIHSIYYAGKEATALKDLEAKARKAFQDRNYDVIQFEQGMATIKIDRSLLAGAGFLSLLESLLDEAIAIQAEVA
ncbi:MAG: hypothetical protein ABRQ24_03630 [Syntrophomonadaceae bacterium]